MKAFRLGIVLLITLISVVVAFSGVELHQILPTMQEAHWMFFAGVFAGYFVTHCIRTLRLWLLLGYKGTFSSMFSINTIGFLAINVIPLRMGEFVRPYLLVEKEQIPFSDAAVAIVLERWLDMCMLLIMLMGLGFFVEIPSAGIQIKGIDLVSTGQRTLGVMVTLGMIGGGLLMWLGEKVLTPFSKHSTPLIAKIAAFILSLRQASLRLFTNPVLTLQAVGLSMAVWGGTMMAIWSALWAFDDLPHQFGVVWTVWTVTLVGMIVAPTPGFIGVYELFCSTALWLFGVDKTAGTTFALVLHSSQLIFTLVIGGIFLLKEGFNLRHLVQKSQENQANTPESS